jgi:flavin reductase (DIM6/NTAB) family NADH-FMN oxidoreductase RutF
VSPRRIDPGIEAGGAGGEHRGPGVAPEAFREALGRWVSGVSVVAVRDEDDGRVYATTVSSLGGVSAEPPRISFSLGPGAQVLPFLPEGGRFAVSVLARDQARLARIFTDAFPVGPSPFPGEGDPVIPGCHVGLVCAVDRVVAVDASRVVVALVLAAEPDDAARPLVYYRREYRSLE